MTKGELEAYSGIMGALNSLIYQVEWYCHDYKCGNELLSECKRAKDAINEARINFNKYKRKK